MSYIVLAPDGRAYGTFATADSNTNKADTDAEYWAQQNNMGSAPVVELIAPAGWVPPIPEADTTG